MRSEASGTEPPASSSRFLTRFPQFRAFGHRDFRLLWLGAFFSFMGSWVQNVAQGWLVYELTGDEAKLAFVTFCSMLPVSFLGPLAGSFVDAFDKRRLLVFCQAVFGLSALFLALMTYLHLVEYWHIILVALVNGLVSTIEMPARQSVVSRVVPPEDLPAAVPLNAMTFNLSRLLGPAIGAVLLAAFGPQTCYLVNGLSYMALIGAMFAIRSDLRALPRSPEPIADLLFEGMRYTFKDARLRVLFIMEAVVSCFGLFYLALMPAIAKRMLGLDKAGLGVAMSVVGVGTITGLLWVTSLSSRPMRARIVGVAMTVMGAGIFLLGFARSEWVAFPLLAVVGGAAVMQFNTTNTLFQLLSPERLRGRVLSMHVWALSGLAPPGVIFFGWLARDASIPVSLHVGGLCVLAGALWGYTQRRHLATVD